MFAYLAISLVGDNRIEEARAATAEAVRRAPRYSIERFMRSEPFRDEATLERFRVALRKAEFPE
jgi:hypothetical protein